MKFNVSRVDLPDSLKGQPRRASDLSRAADGMVGCCIANPGSWFKLESVGISRPVIALGWAFKRAGIGNYETREGLDGSAYARVPCDHLPIEK